MDGYIKTRTAKAVRVFAFFATTFYNMNFYIYEKRGPFPKRPPSYFRKSTEGDQAFFFPVRDGRISKIREEMAAVSRPHTREVNSKKGR